MGKLSRSRLQFIKKNINRRDDSWCSLYRPDRDAAGSSCSLPVISLLTLFVSLFLLFQPSISVAKNADQQSSNKRDTFRADRSGKDAHERIRESAQRTADAAEKNEDVAARTDEVLKDLDDAESEDVENEKRFDEIEKKLKEIGASAALSRHREVVREYTVKSKEFKKHAGALRDAKKKKVSKDVIRQKTRDLIDYLDRNTPKKEHDLKSTATRLPWRVAEPGEILLLGDASGMPGQTPAITSTAPPVTNELAPTIDVQITPEIRILAQSLDNQPLKIFRHVYNNYRFTPYDGSMKGSLDTYWEKEGNAYDLSSLLIALLRAANVPARYVKAKVIVPIDRVKRLVGIDDTLAAVQYLSSAKLLLGSYTTGGVISHVLMEHVYVEAYVPYANYRGTGEDDSGKVWVPLDPGFKQLTVAQEGTDLSTAMGLDWKQFADSYFGAMRNVTPLELYKEKVDQYVSVNHPGKTLDELLRKTEVKTMLFDFLPNSLPYTVQEVTGRFAEIPAEKRYTVRFKMFNNFEYATTLPEVAGRRITLTHAAATPEDQAVINKFGTIFDAPPYAIKLKPQLRVDGMVRAEGTAVQGGSTLGFNVEYTDTAAKTEVLDHKVTSGSYNAVGFTIGKVRPEMASIASVEESAEPYISKMLHSLAMKYHDTANRSRRFLNDSLKIQSRTYITEALVSTRHDIRYVWGIPVSFTMAGYMIDAKEMASGVVPIAGGDRKKIIDFMMLSGLEASFQENRTFEDSMFWVSGLSASRAIPLLKAMGVTIQELEPGTVYFNPALPELVVSDINNALNMGWKVIVPQETRGLPVTPYIKYDPKTGSAGYMIASAAGGFSGFIATSAELHNKITYSVTFNPDVRQLLGVSFGTVFPESGITIPLGTVFNVGIKMLLRWKEGGNEWTEEVVSPGNMMTIPTGPWVVIATNLPLPWWNPGNYRITYNSQPIFEFNLWGVSISAETSSNYMGISKDNGADIVKYPYELHYGITHLSNLTVDAVALKIKNNAGDVIRTRSLPTVMGPGQIAVWDGKNDSGQVVAPGEYIAAIEASGTGGTTKTEYPATVLRIDAEGHHAKSGQPAGEFSEEGAGVVIQDETVAPAAKLIAHAPGLDGYERDITWSGAINKIVVSTMEQGPYAAPQNEVVNGNEDKSYWIRALPEFSGADSVTATMKIRESGSSEIIFSDAAVLHSLGLAFEKEDPEYPLTKLRWEDYYPPLGTKRIVIRGVDAAGQPMSGMKIKYEVTEPATSVTLTPAMADVVDGKAEFRLSAVGLNPVINNVTGSGVDKINVKFTLLTSANEPQGELIGVWKVKNNANTNLEEVLKGEAVFVYDTTATEKHKGKTTGGTEAKQGVDFVQKMINHVMVPLRRPVLKENQRNTIDVNGFYDGYTKVALDAILNGGEDSTGTMIATSKVSHHMDEPGSPNTFRKLVKDYDGVVETDIGKVISKEILVGLSKNEADTNPVIHNDIGIYEIYLADDWDGDGLSNYVEVENGIDPLLFNANYFPNFTNVSSVPTNITSPNLAYPKGTYGDGRLINGLRMPHSSKGYYQQRGTDAVDTDNYALPDVIRRIERVAKKWEERHPDLAPLKSNIFSTGDTNNNLYIDDGRKNTDGTPQMNGIRAGLNDFSRAPGGRFCWIDNNGNEKCHDSHQNGLDFDVRYVRKDNAEGGVIVTDNTLYDENLSRELINLFITEGGSVTEGGVVRIFVAPEANIAQGGIIKHLANHEDHFHVVFQNPNPPHGPIVLQATTPQMGIEPGVKVSNVSTIAPIRDKYGLTLFEGFEVNVSTDIGAIWYNGEEQGQSTTLPVDSSGNIAFQVKHSAVGIAKIKIYTTNVYGQGQASGAININFQ